MHETSSNSLRRAATISRSTSKSCHVEQAGSCVWALPGFLTVYKSPFNQSLRCHGSWLSIPHRLSLVTVSALQISLVRQQMQQKQQLKISNLSHVFTLKTASTSTESAGVTSGSPMVKSMSITVDHLASLSCEDSLCVRRVARSTTNNRNMLFMVFPMPPLRKLVARPVHRAGQSLARSGLHTTNVNAISKYYQYLSMPSPNKFHACRSIVRDCEPRHFITT